MRRGSFRKPFVGGACLSLIELRHLSAQNRVRSNQLDTIEHGAEHRKRLLCEPSPILRLFHGWTQSRGLIELWQRSQGYCVPYGGRCYSAAYVSNVLAEGAGRSMSFRTDNAAFEMWLRTQCRVVDADLDYKHERMKKKRLSSFAAHIFDGRSELKRSAPS
jgi:hypothetical protein